MYSSGYSQVSRFSPEAQKMMRHRSKSKSCGYYMRIVFFFSSLIQSLIIVSLVLFLIYGKSEEDSADKKDLIEQHSQLSIENIKLRQQRKNLTNLLNVTVTEKARNDWDLLQLRYYANISYHHIIDLGKKLNQCTADNVFCKATTYGQAVPCRPFSNTGNCNCGAQVEHLKAMTAFIQSNFTQTVQTMKMEMEQVSKVRDNINLETIQLRRDKSILEKELAIFKTKCKEEFIYSLSGITNVSRVFLEKIDSLVPLHFRFHFSCDKQREYLEQIRTNCTTLSREVETKFQYYVNNLGDQVSSIQAENSRLKAENYRLFVDYRLCTQNRTGLIQEHRTGLQVLQLKHDREKEQLLMEKKRLNGDIDVLSNSINYKEKQVAHLNEQLRQLNISCMAKATVGLSSGALSFGTGTLAHPGSSWNKPNTGGMMSGSSSSSSGSLFNRLGSGGSMSSQNKLTSTGMGSSSGSAGSSLNLGSATSVLTKSALSPSNSESNSGSSSGSARLSPNLSSTAVGSSKPVSSGKSSSGFGSTSGSSSSTGSTSKSGTSGSALSWLGLGLGSKSGSGTGRGSAGGSSGTPSGGKTSGLVGVPASVSQHLQDLRRIVNPSASEEKRDFSGILG
ncbi:plasmalemma vesicle associated protein a isoform X2 [Thalassophryne amazonica]|uniref:plasmalemma vesicle associated protein a isoform X2 n=1 Tax=Thalassophryne amazonica TaxID=390379 RepID=UPI00147236B9|nr:plasmalemma vesicle associated protein a isoform X2 [Thalassophryne amazonica]